MNGVKGVRLNPSLLLLEDKEISLIFQLVVKSAEILQALYLFRVFINSKVLFDSHFFWE